MIGKSSYFNKVCYLNKETSLEISQIPEGINPIEFERFDSELERHIYQKVKTWINRKNEKWLDRQQGFWLDLHRQININLIPDEGIEVNHVVDFSISLQADFSQVSRYDALDTDYRQINTWYVEAKGKPSAEAILKWKMLESRYGYFESGNYIVFGSNRKAAQAINNHPIHPYQKGLSILDKAINTFVDVYKIINSMR